MKLKLIVILFLVVGVGFCAIAQKTDFSGNWKINVEKSKLDDSNGFTKGYNIVQKGDDLSLEWTIEFPDGKHITWAEKITLGKGDASKFLTDMQRTRFMSASFSQDGKNILLNKKLSKVNKSDEIDSFYQLNERWSLSADGKELLVEMTTPANPELMTKAYYTK